ncbi:MAG: YcbK family protein [Alphaproteobacteria bacterium]
MILFQHWQDIPSTFWRWAPFAPFEFASKGNGSLLVIPAALDTLCRAQEILGDKKLRINSAYRDPLHNARVGGAPLSRHKMGDAFDISIRGQDRAAVYNACRAAGFQGFGFYNSFLHVDLGRARTWGKWPGITHVPVVRAAVAAPKPKPKSTAKKKRTTKKKKA